TPVGSLEYDRDHGYSLEWNSMTELEAWLNEEEESRLTYPGTSTILGHYEAEHSHPTGSENACYTCMSKQTHAEVERLLRLGISPDKVLNQIRGQVFSEENLDALKSGNTACNQFIMCHDICRIKQMIEAETIRLASQDGVSV
ncbi:hypothetical protein BT96DRAFT_745261, partial [Gymnopus androsaceus JB14]